MSSTTGNTNNVTFAQRHAPKSFGDLVFEDVLAQQRLALYAANHLHNSVLLHGPYGTAKTTTALTIISDRRRLTGCHGHYLHQYSGGDLAGSLKPVLNSLSMMLSLDPDPHPYVLIDEADKLTKSGQLEMRQLLSTMPYLRVILTTNEIAKVDGGVQSRCDCIQLLPPTTDDWAPSAQAWLANEGVSLPVRAVQQLINGATDIRRILRTLEAFVVQSRLATGQAAPLATSPFAAPALSVLQGNGLVAGSGLNGGNGPNLTVLAQQKPGGPGQAQP